MLNFILDVVQDDGTARLLKTTNRKLYYLSSLLTT